MRTNQLVILLGFALTMDIALFSIGIQQREIRQHTDRLNSDLERVDHSLERVQRNFESIQRDLEDLQKVQIQGPRWQCVPGMTADAGGGSEACVWVDRQARGQDRDAQP